MNHSIQKSPFSTDMSAHCPRNRREAEAAASKTTAGAPGEAAGAKTGPQASAINPQDRKRGEIRDAAVD